MKPSTYVIYAPGFDPNNGGSIVLHQLCHYLNQLGQCAVLQSMKPLYKVGRRARLAYLFKKPKFNLSPDLNTPLANKSDVVDTSIVVYPELIAGNPLNAKNVVRWLLHRPGFHNGVVDYGAEDLFFKFDDFCDDETITGGDIKKMFIFTLNNCYRNEGIKKRQGSCYIIRKGKGKPMLHDMDGSIQIDGLEHQEIAKIFNQCEIFYSYDEATMYSQLAAICGCMSVVFPDTYADRKSWAKDHPLSRYGVAYGLDDLAHARATQHKVLRYLQELEQTGLDSVRQFVEITQQHFDNDNIAHIRKDEKV